MLIYNYLDKCASSADRTLLDFIFNHCQEALGMSLGEIADRTFVSKTSVLRLIKKLGFEGFADFKEELAREAPYIIAGNAKSNPNKPFEKGEKPVYMIEDLRRVYQETINDTAALLETAPVDMASQIIQEAHHIEMLAGYGGQAIAKVFGQDMQLIGRNVCYLDMNVPCVDGIVQKKDALIIVSYQELPEHVYDILRKVHKIGTKIIIISSLGINRLKDYADVFLPVSSYECRYRKIKAFSSQLSMMMVMNTLFACYFQKDYDKHLKYRYCNAQKIFNKRSIIVDE